MALLPVIDLPLPLVVLGSVMLAIASNRIESNPLVRSQQTPEGIKDTSASQSQNRQKNTGHFTAVDPRDQNLSGARGQSSPSLPNISATHDPNSTSVSQRPISPKITPQSPHPNSPATEPLASSPSEPGGGTAHHSSSPPNPQLPNFVRPNPTKKAPVSFTIENKE